MPIEDILDSLMDEDEEPQVTFDSECLHGASYDRSQQELTLWFQKRGTYVYFGVGSDVFKTLKLASSKGRYFNRAIRPNYSYMRIE